MVDPEGVNLARNKAKKLAGFRKKDARFSILKKIFPFCSVMIGKVKKVKYRHLIFK